MRIYIIGAGHIARDHARAAGLLQTAFFPDEPLELFAADPIESARTAFLDKFPNATVTSSPEEMLSAPAHETDIAIVATPPFLHLSGALLALKSGRHALVEKPLALSNEEANQIALAAKNAGKHFGDCSMRLYDTASTRGVRELLQSGKIGVPYHATHTRKSLRGRPGIEYQPVSKWFLDKAKAGGGALMDWGVYDIALLTAVLEPVKVEIRSAWMTRTTTEIDPTDIPFDVETHCGAAMLWHNAKGDTINVSYERSSDTHGTPRDVTEVEGSHGAVTFDWAWGANSKATRRFDVQGEISEEELEFSDPQEATWGIGQGDRPLFTFYRAVIRGEQIPALVDETSLFNFRVVRGLIEAAESQQSVTVQK